MKKFFAFLLLFYSVNLYSQSYVTTNTVQTITANKNFSSTYYGFNGYSTQWLSEGVKTGWLIAIPRLDVTSTTQPSLVMSRVTDGTTTSVNYSGGGFELAVGNYSNPWTIPSNAGDVVFKSEGPSSIVIGSQNGNIRFELGNVLIGKTSQTNTSYILDVNGKERVNEIVVNTTGADFVFEPNYNLMPIKKIEEYIDLNHHLPDIQPAWSMQKNGVEVGDNEAKLLQKIEELTLYIIQENKRLDHQQSIVNSLYTQLQKQQKVMNQLHKQLTKSLNK